MRAQKECDREVEQHPICDRSETDHSRVCSVEGEQGVYGEDGGQDVGCEERQNGNVQPRPDKDGAPVSSNESEEHAGEDVSEGMTQKRLDNAERDIGVVVEDD